MECAAAIEFTPRRETCLQIDALPLLGTGKLDLRTVKQPALERSR